MNFTKIKNEDLYELCLRGDESAWEYIYNYVFRLVRSGNWKLPDSLEDTTQSIVCHLLTKGIDRVRKPGAFRGYVKRVAVNFILDQLGIRRFICISIDEENEETGYHVNVPDPNPDPEEAALFGSLVRAIEQSIKNLPRKCRDVLDAYIDYKCGLYKSYKMMAKALGRSIGTLSAQINRCLEELKMMDEIKNWL